MKALIRNAGETVRETDGIDGIDWTTGAPLTNESWCGGAYALAADCPPDAEPSDFDITEETVTVQEATEDEPAVTTVRRIATLDAARYEARRAAQAAEPEPTPDPIPEAPAEAPETPSDDDEIVVINGVQYTKAQLREMMEGSQ